MKRDRDWMQRWCEAYSYGHNVLRLVGRYGPSADCSRFARAYADVTEHVGCTIDHFADFWKTGQVEPDEIGTYHRCGPWAAAEKDAA